MKMGRALKYDIGIRSSDNEGFIAQVGCGIFVFADKESLIMALTGYLDNTERWEKEYNEKVGIHTAPLSGTAGNTRDPRDAAGRPA